MATANLARLRCYWLIAGIEQAIASNLANLPQVEQPDFLTNEQKDRSLKRLREDYEDPSWTLSDVNHLDLFEYLDLGDLLQLLQKHSGRDSTISSKDARQFSDLVEQRGLISIRKRVMHPVRPLEESDLADLLEITDSIVNATTDFNWSNLRQSIIQQESGSFGNIEIPHYWADDLSIPNNLPSADFDETGFIGRTRERKQLSDRLSSNQSVITVVGEAGTGKTSIALRVLIDLIDQGTDKFDRVVWVTLKTRRFTSSGITEITDAIDSVGGLLRELAQVMGIEPSEPNWDAVIQSMTDARILLVIDNLETLGDELRELFLRVPEGSKVLTTSRVGLGEIEERFVLPSFENGAAINLVRSLANAYNYKGILQLPHDEIRGHCSRLNNTPLLVKWLVHAIAGGADPSLVPSGDQFQEALRFCYENVYEQLDEPARDMASVLLASRRDLSRTQLQDLLGLDHVEFQFAIQSLLRCSIATQNRDESGSYKFRIDGLVREYLSANYPPENTLVVDVRTKLREWQETQDQSTIQTNASRYRREWIHVSDIDEQVAHRYLESAFVACRGQDFQLAEKHLNAAERLTPDWWEVFRVRAQILVDQNAPIYEVEEAFERSLDLTKSDIPRYFYAVYLIGQNEISRAIELLNDALDQPGSAPEFLLSQRGRANTRLGRYEEAIEDLESALKLGDQTTFTSDRTTHINYTQLAETYRRLADQSRMADDFTKAYTSIKKAIELLDHAMKRFGVDYISASTCLDIGISLEQLPSGQSSDNHEIISLFLGWDNDAVFRSLILSYRPRIQTRFTRFGAMLAPLFPKTHQTYERGLTGISTGLPNPVQPGYLVGIVINASSRFGFISCPDVPSGSVHYNASSLSDNCQMWDIRIGSVVEFNIQEAAQGTTSRNLTIHPDQALES